MKLTAIGLGMLAVCGNALALDPNYLASEQSFREAAGKRAQRIAKGVYEVRNGSGSVSRFSFGSAGLGYEIELLQARLEELEALPENAIPHRRELVDGLNQLRNRLVGAQLKQATTKTLPTNCGFTYKIIATVTPGFAYGSAKASAEYLNIGPPPPYIPELHTYAYAGSDTGVMQSTDTRRFGSEPYAKVNDAEAYTGPTFTQFLDANAYMHAIGCPDGFRGVSDHFDPY